MTIVGGNALSSIPTPSGADGAGNSPTGGSVRGATTAALAANTYANGTAGIGATLTGNANGSINPIDGLTLAVGDRLLVKNEVATLGNGIYTVTTVGTGSVPYVLTRSTDFDTAAEIKPGTIVTVAEGTTNADTAWLLTSNAPITVGTTALTFASFGAGIAIGSSVSGGTATRVLFVGAGPVLADDAGLTYVAASDALTVAGSVSTPSLISTAAVGITPAAGSNLNVTLSTTGDFAVNTSQFYVDTSTTFVGVGTVPTSLFHVASTVGSANAMFENTTNTAGQNFRVFSSVAGASGGDPSFILQITGVAAYYIGIDNSDSDKLMIGGNSGSIGSDVFMTINSIGNVGIGTTTPNSALDVSGNISIRYPGTFLLRDATNTFNLVTLAADASNNVQLGGSNITDLIFASGSGVRMTMKQAGNFGIGTNAPSGQLDVSSGNLTMVLGADSGLTTRTNVTAKYTRVGSYHYTNAEEPMGLIYGESTSSTGIVRVGGGTSTVNTATAIELYTAGNNTTVTGTLAGSINTSQNWTLGVVSNAGATLDVPGNALTMIVGSDAGGAKTRTNATTKESRVGAYHYTNAEEPMAVWQSSVASGAAQLTIGGGTSTMNAATTVEIYAAANTTTVTGTAQLVITSTAATFTNIVTAPGYALTTTGLITDSTTARTLAATDNGAVIQFTNGSAKVVTVNTGLADNFSVTLIQVGAGAITFAGTGTIVNRSSFTGSAGTNAVIGLQRLTNGNFVLFGDCA